MQGANIFRISVRIGVTYPNSLFSWTQYMMVKARPNAITRPEWIALNMSSDPRAPVKNENQKMGQNMPMSMIPYPIFILLRRWISRLVSGSGEEPFSPRRKRRIFFPSIV
ncbi:MAG: hypothetical protein PHF71_10725 [Methanoculleus sp.]|nr:hypothetical protein [Methanoculleus sp.]